MFETLLITGGAGFIGGRFVEFVRRQRPAWRLVVLDAMTYAADADTVAGFAADPGIEFVRGDIRDRDLVDRLLARRPAVAHLAAESHVDRSIQDSGPFVSTNVLGTQTLLDAAVRHKAPRFLHVSTDEVYGSLPLDRPDLRFTEDTPLAPNSPYAASKAASDLLVRAFHETFGLNASITRCSNNFGSHQFPEKVIPLFVTNLIDGKPVPLYGDGANVRDWLHVEDHCEALLAVLERGAPGRVYNIGGDNERTNRELTHALLAIMGKGPEMIRPVPDRLGHDRRYAIDPARIRDELGWRPTRSAWPAALASTARWYIDHPDWWRKRKG